jgi:hypothetical protein
MDWRDDWPFVVVGVFMAFATVFLFTSIWHEAHMPPCVVWSEERLQGATAAVPIQARAAVPAFCSGYGARVTGDVKAWLDARAEKAYSRE